MTVSQTIASFNLFALVFCRVGGMVFFNPLLSRKNIPSRIRLGLALLMTILIAPGLSVDTVDQLEGFSLFMSMVGELFVGFCFGLLFQIYYYMLFVAGDVIDTGFGLSSAKEMDPGTSIQVSMSSNFFQMLFVLYFFATDCHLIFIKLIDSTFDLAAPGIQSFGRDIGGFLCTQFVYSFGLIMHLALPFLAASFVMEIAMGVLMKLISQINVFSIHFQLKILVGMGLLFLFTVPVTNFIQSYISELFEQMQELLRVIMAG